MTPAIRKKEKILENYLKNRNNARRLLCLNLGRKEQNVIQRR